MEKSRDYIKGAVEMAIFVDAISESVPQQPYTFNVVRKGNFWEIQFIYTANIEEKPSGVYHSGKGEYIPFEVTGELDPIQLSEDFDMSEILINVRKSIATIYANEYRG